MGFRWYSGSTLVPRAPLPPYWFIVRLKSLDTNLLRHWIRKYPNCSPVHTLSTLGARGFSCAVSGVGRPYPNNARKKPLVPRVHVIRFVEDISFSILESGCKNIRIRCRMAPEFAGCVWTEEKVADSKISG